MLDEHTENEDGHTEGPLADMIENIRHDIYTHGLVLAACVAKFSCEDCVCIHSELEGSFKQVADSMVTLQEFERFLTLRLEAAQES